LPGNSYVYVADGFGGLLILRHETGKSYVYLPLVMSTGGTPWGE
jgi:hypothetical protein